MFTGPWPPHAPFLDSSRCLSAVERKTCKRACRYHGQRQPRYRIRPQAQPDHRQERHDPRSGDRGGQSTRQRSIAADAGTPHRLLWSRAAAGGGRRRLCQSWQSGYKTLGVRDMAFHKKAGLRIEDMVKSNWVYRKLRNFRAGIEADISCLKLADGLARFTLARSSSLQEPRLVFGRGLQSRPLHAPQAYLRPVVSRSQPQTGERRPKPWTKLPSATPPDSAFALHAPKRVLGQLLCSRSVCAPLLPGNA